VAQSWETPDDRTIILKLNPNAKFQDGRPVTAQDVKWTYDSTMAENFVTSKKSGYSAVDRIEAPDAQTVIFHLKEPNGGLFDNLTLGIMPQGSDANAAKSKPVSVGPYKVVNFRTDESVELEASEHWHLGTPKIRNLTVRIIPDATTLVLELRRGTIDLEINQIPFENVGEFEKSPKHQVIKKPGSVWQYLAFNLRDPVLRKVEVRRAIAHAIDRQKIVTDLLRGTAFRPTPCSRKGTGPARTTCPPTRSIRQRRGNCSTPPGIATRTATGLSPGSRSRSRRPRTRKRTSARR
jgi:peptide/nickel transport system substrate-binding protein